MSDQHDRRDDDLRERVRDALDSLQRPAPGLLRRCADAVARDRRRIRVPRPVSWAVVAGLAAAVVAVTLMQHVADRGVHGPVVTPSAAPAARQLLYALTAGNEVEALDRATLRVRWHTAVAAPPSEAVGSRSALALSRDGTMLFVLPPADGRGGTTVVLLDAGGGRRLGAIALSAPGGAVYGSLAVNPQSGDLYAVGQDAGHVVVTVVDPAQRLVLATQVTRTLPATPAPNTDRAAQAEVSDDGTRLYYSFGGGNADRSGIDWATVSGPRLLPCTSRAGAACIPAPGGSFALLDGHVYFTGDTTPTTLVEADAGGAVVRRVTTALASGSASVELDRAGGRVVVLGDCTTQGGLAGIDVASGQVSNVATPAPAGTDAGGATVCGEQPVLLGGTTLAVARISGSNASPESPGNVDAVDLTTGRILRSATLPAEVDALLAGG